MDRPDLLASVLVDEAIAVAMMPWPCPCDFGPSARYRLEELVGAGPRSLVYKAHDRLLSSEGFSAAVAIKIMKGGATGAEREALTARRVVHPNVVRILDRGEDPTGCSYLVTEFLDGGDMSQRPAPWKPADATRFMAKVARAVQAAHSAGVVHCDLKPSNVLISADGEPKLGDFDLSASSLNTSSSGRGNIAFMSPEQFAGEENALSPPSDIYALGGMLYHLLTGQLPSGASHDEVARAHAGGAQRLPIKGDLGLICNRAMAPRPEDRYHSAGELADDLDRCLRTEPLPWARPGPHRRAWMWARRNPFRAAAISLVILGSGAALGIFEYERVQQRQRDREATERTVRLASERVEAIKARVRRTLEVLMATFMAPGSDIPDRMLPGLTWIEWLGDYKILGDDGRVLAAGERVIGLRALLQNLKDQNRGDQVTAMLTRYCLAYFLIMDGDSVESSKLLDELEQTWVPRLAPDDAFVISIRGMETCAKANAAAVTGDAVPESLDALQKLSTHLRAQNICVPIRRLADRTAAHLRNPQKPKAEEPTPSGP